jgi:hypothetical protein
MRNETEGENSVFEEEKRQDLSTPAPGGDPLEKQLSTSLVKNRRELFHFFSFLGRRRLRPRPPRDLWSCLSLKFFFVFSSSALSLSLYLSPLYSPSHLHAKDTTKRTPSVKEKRTYLAYAVLVIQWG